MAYTTIDDPSAYFQTKIYSGTGSDLSLTFDGNSNMQPDWVWLKRRSGSGNHFAWDAVRGVNAALVPNDTDAEDTSGESINYFDSFDSNGFTVGGGGYANTNASGSTYVGWCWKAGTSFTNDASSTGIGTIDSTGSVNDTAGFSIISYNGTGANGSIKHGLSTAPRAMIFKNRDEGAEGWFVYHESVGNTKRAGLLDANGSASTSSTFFQDTSPTSSIITLGSNHGCNGPDAMICYAFSERKGYSKFGSYTGNGNASGPFIYTGFKPAWIMYKNTARAISWLIHDNKRLGYNPDNDEQHPDTAAADGTDDRADILSNGFKIRESSNLMNVSGEQVVYMAFAESPFVNSKGVPTTAR